MVGVVSSISSGGNFILADFETPRCQFCTKMPEMLDLCYLGKTRLFSFTKTVPLSLCTQNTENTLKYIVQSL